MLNDEFTQNERLYLLYTHTHLRDTFVVDFPFVIFTCFSSFRSYVNAFREKKVTSYKNIFISHLPLFSVSILHIRKTLHGKS